MAYFEFENGVTSINDTNLNSMQDFIKKQIHGEVLFENELGQIGNITLLNNITDYRCISIYYSVNDTLFSKMILPLIDKKFVLDGMIFISSQKSENFSSTYTITSNSLTVNSSLSGYFQRDYSTGNISGNTQSTEIKIHKVIGYK